MSQLEQYEMVRVRRLLRPPDSYDDWKANRRPPESGDVGVLLDVLQTPGVADGYVVECSETDGATVWLSTFVADELEPVSDGRSEN